MSEINYNFSGKNFVVTGASSGIGRQIAVELAQAGAHVLAIARNEARLLEIYEKYPYHIRILASDIGKQDKILNSVKSFVDEFGKIHGSVYAAGITDITPFKNFDMDRAKEIMEISFWNGILFMQLVHKKSYVVDGSSHLLFSSTAASSTERGMFAYAGAKAAIRTAVRVLAKEISTKKHRINTISPGFVKTNMTDNCIVDENILSKHLLGIGIPTDISGVALFLLSDRASWITGTDIVVDGGYLA